MDSYGILVPCGDGVPGCENDAVKLTFRGLFMRRDATEKYIQKGQPPPFVRWDVHSMKGGYG